MLEWEARAIFEIQISRSVSTRYLASERWLCVYHPIHLMKVLTAPYLFILATSFILMFLWATWIKVRRNRWKSVKSYIPSSPINTCKILSYQYVANRQIVEMFYILFSYQVLEIRCVFCPYSAPPFGLAHFKPTVGTRGYHIGRCSFDTGSGSLTMWDALSQVTQLVHFKAGNPVQKCDHRGALSSRNGLGKKVFYVRIPQCLLTFWPGWFFVVGNYPVHCKLFTTSSVSTH